MSGKILDFALELFREQPTIVDQPNARPLAVCKGDIRFDNVEFFYDARKPALNSLTFHCEPGSTTALVDDSGGGNSTVFRLLFRFYNSERGRILVDRHDVESITIDSLRKHIRVVPQDTVLIGFLDEEQKRQVMLELLNPSSRLWTDLNQ